MDSMLFKKAIKKNPDLIHATTFPETDEDVVVGIILRFLHDNIFQKIMYGSIQNYTEVISFIENFMQTAVEPKRGMFRFPPQPPEKEKIPTQQYRSILHPKLDSRSIQLPPQRPRLPRRPNKTKSRIHARTRHYAQDILQKRPLPTLLRRNRRELHNASHEILRETASLHTPLLS